MNWKTLIFSLLLVDFIGLTAFAIHAEGLAGLLEVVSSSWWGVQVGVDLVIALCVAMFWMSRDAPGHDIDPRPFYALTLTLGSIGVLAYLVLRSVRGEARSEAPVRAV